MATETSVVIGGEGDVTLNGTTWCVEELSITENETEQSINNVCDFDEDERVTYERSVVTARRLTGEFTVQLDRNKKVLGNGTGELRSGKSYTGTIKIFAGHTITGTFKVGSIAGRNGGPTGISGWTVPFASQGKYVIT